MTGRERPSMFNLKIKSLTFISRENSSTHALINLFKKTVRIDLLDLGVKYWYYPDKGLQIIDDQENKEILEFYTL